MLCFCFPLAAEHLVPLYCWDGSLGTHCPVSPVDVPDAPQQRHARFRHLSWDFTLQNSPCAAMTRRLFHRSKCEHHLNVNYSLLLNPLIPHRFVSGTCQFPLLLPASPVRWAGHCGSFLRAEFPQENQGQLVKKIKPSSTSGPKLSHVTAQRSISSCLA